MKNIALIQKILILILLKTLSVSCATGGKNEVHPPDKEFLDEIKTARFEKSLNGLSPSKKYALIFLMAKSFQSQSKNNQACENYQTLKNKNDFPLAKLSLIRSIETCSYQINELSSLWDSNPEIPKWLKKEYLEVSLKKSNELKLHKYIAKFSKSLSAFKRTKTEKEELLQKALKEAKRAKLNKEEIQKYRESLYEISPRLKKDLEKEDYYKAARDFERKREFDKARNLYNRIMREEHPAKTKINTLNRIAMTYKLERDLEKYTDKTKSAVKELISLWQMTENNDPEKDIYHEAWVDGIIKQARAEWTQHRRDKAERLLMYLISTKFQNKEKRALAHWLLGAIQLERKDHQKALKRFKKALSIESKDKKLKDKLTWNIAWNYFLTGDSSNAIKYFELYKDTPKSNFEKQKRYYWLSRSQELAGLKKDASLTRLDLIKNDPYGYYGALARRDQNQKFNPIEVKNTSNAPYILEFEWLSALEEKDIAQSFLKQYRYQFKSLEEKEGSLSLFDRVDWYEGGVHQFFRIPSDHRTKALHKFASIAYPSPFKDVVKNNAKDFKLPESLFYAIMRQESAFNPIIRSWADAFGLMQMIPKRAKSLSAQHNIKYLGDPEELFKPEVNIALGGALLKELSEKFNGGFIPMVASYNASEKAVNHWRHERFDGEPVKFIEMIPYEETKGYVKLVIRNYIMYERLNSNKDFYFDDNLLTMGL